MLSRVTAENVGDLFLRHSVVLWTVTRLAKIFPCVMNVLNLCPIATVTGCRIKKNIKRAVSLNLTKFYNMMLNLSVIFQIPD